MKYHIIFITSILLLLPTQSIGFAGTAASLLDDLYRIYTVSYKVSRNQFSELLWRNPNIVKPFVELPKHSKLKVHAGLAAKRELILVTKQTYYINKYSKFPKGDELFSTCLKHRLCDVDEYHKILEKSPLHRQIAIRNSGFKLFKVNKAVGEISENLMNKYYQSSGWTKIKGEIGINGIDGLFVKKRNGTIIDVLVVESKYNKSGLQHTNNGQQMSKQWVSQKVKDLQDKYSDNPDYNSIQKFVDKDSYRSLLWNVKINDNKLLITLMKVHDKTGEMTKQPLKDIEINLDSPQIEFHQKIALWYKEEIDKY